MDRKCGFCNSIYKDGTGFGECCSRSCYYKAYYRKKKSKKDCKICGKSFVGGKNELYCSSECKRIALTSKDKICTLCGKKFKGGRNGKYCSEICYRLSNGTSMPYKLKTCYVCSSKFTDAKTSDSITCSSKCENKKIKKSINEIVKEIKDAQKVKI